MLFHAKNEIPFYQRVLANLDINEIRSFADLNKIPIMTKEILKDEFVQLIHSGNRFGYKKTTGGSTGNPVTIFKSAKSISAADAAMWRGYEWAGIKIGDRQARFWGVPHKMHEKIIARIKDIINNRRRYSAFSFDDETLAEYYWKIEKFKPKYFYGYVSMLEAFARFMEKNKLHFKYPPCSVIATSEVLTAAHRTAFKKEFCSKVFNEYGCGEVGTIAHECEFGKMHISAENMILEIVDNNGIRASIGEEGEIVITELNNLRMPLIRYNLRDRGKLDPNPCQCGRGLPVLGEIFGRSYDIIYNKEGKAFHGEYFMYIYENAEKMGLKIMGFQVIQLDFDRFVIKMIMENENRKLMEELINKELLKSYGGYIKINFEYVDVILREKSGKMRLIKTLMNG